MSKKNALWMILLIIGLSTKSLLAQPSTINGTLKVYPSQNMTTPTTPGALKLMVVPGPSATVLEANSDNNWVNHDIILNAANPSGGNQNQLVVHRSGNIGIGIATPGYKLHIPGNTQLAVGYTFVDNSIDVDNSYVRSNFGSNVYWDAVNNLWQVGQIGANDFTSIVHTNQNGLAFLTAGSTGNTLRPLTNSQFFAFERMRIDASGKIGVGTASPEALLHVGTSNLGYIRTVRMMLEPPQHTGAAWEFSVRDDQASSYLGIGYGSEQVTFNHNGNIGIGTTAPDAKLAVKGHIHTQEVRVDLTGAVAPDYVFEKDYNLLPLSELETYITQNKHLPEVPSAKEMEAEGLNLKEMNLILLKKVEELTLHLIEMKKENAIMNERIEKLEKN